MRALWPPCLLALCLVVLAPVACGKVEEDDSFTCDVPVASYCAAHVEGCPAGDTPEDVCRWLSRVGGHPGGLRGDALGYPLHCSEHSERTMFNVTVDGTTRTYFFVSGSLYYVFEIKPAARCVAGPQRVPSVPCSFVDFLDTLACAAYTTDGGVD